MLNNIKNLASSTVIYGAGQILSRTLVFLLLPIYTNYLTEAELGIVTLITSFIAAVNLFYLYGLDSAFMRYYVLTENKTDRTHVFSTVIIALIFSSIVFSAGMLLFAAPISTFLLGDEQYAFLVKLSALILSLDSVSLIPQMLLRGEDRKYLFVSVKFLYVIINLVFTIWFVVFLGWNIRGVVFGQFIASIGTFIGVVIISIPYFRFYFSKTLLKEFLKFGLPYLPTTCAVILMDVIDRFILEHFHGAEMVGVYSAGYRLAMIMALIITGFRFAWQPFFLSTAKNKDAQQIFGRVLTYFLLVCGFLYLLVAFFVDELVRFQVFGKSFFAPEFWQSTQVVPIVMLAYIIFGMYANFVTGIHIKKKSQYLPFITGLGAVSNITLNFALIPSWGMIGAAWATVLSYSVMTASLYLVNQKLYPTPYEFSRIFKLICVTSLCFLIQFYFSLTSLQRTILLMSYPLILYLVGFFTRSEMLRLSKFVKSKIGVL